MRAEGLQAIGYETHRDALHAEWAAKLPDHSSCPVCLRAVTPDDAVLLTRCLHTVCRMCAVTEGPTLTCPHCNLVSLVNTGRLAPARPSALHDSADDSPASSSSPTSSPASSCSPTSPCATAACKCGEPAVTACLECQTVLCEGHRAEHAESKTLRRHVLTSVATPFAKTHCAVHAAPLTGFCRTCSVAVCNACLSSRHTVPPHRVVLLDEANGDTMRKRLRRSVTRLRATATECIDAAVGARAAAATLQDEHARVAESVVAAFAAWRRMLELREEALLAKLASRVQTARDEYTEVEAASGLAWRAATMVADTIEQTVLADGLPPVALAELGHAAAQRAYNTLADVHPPPLPAPQSLSFVIKPEKELNLTGLIDRLGSITSAIPSVLNGLLRD